MARQRAWHTLKRNMRSKNGYEPPWRDGEKRTEEKKIEMCWRGYHASRTLGFAAYWKYGPVLCRVELSGKMIHQSSKSVAQSRRLLWHLHPGEWKPIIRAFFKTRGGGNPVDGSWEKAFTELRWSNLTSEEERILTRRLTAKAREVAKAK